MFSAFLFALRLYFKLCIQSLRRSDRLGPLSLKGTTLRLLLYLACFPVFLVNWIGLFLDEILFRGYRRVVITEPVMVLGVPRSGTTFLHRTLAADSNLFTTVATWEVFLAPSVTQRVFWRGLSRIDRLFGQPFARLLAGLEKKLFSGLEGVHDVSLEAAEEDYLLLLPILSSFILFLAFTESNYIWNLSRLDWDMNEKDRRRILHFYRACLQKHLYFHGTDRVYLSKNAAFASWIISLQDEFPDARIIVCLREPERAVPSLIGSLESGAGFFELDLRDGSLSPQLVEMMQDSYRHLITRRRPAWEIIHMKELQASVDDCVRRIYQRFNLPMSEQYRATLAVLTDQSRQFATRNRPIDPPRAEADNFFRTSFPWYYELVEGSDQRYAEVPEADT